jgi:hypothetical protein
MTAKARTAVDGLQFRGREGSGRAGDYRDTDL